MGEQDLAVADHDVALVDHLVERGAQVGEAGTNTFDQRLGMVPSTSLNASVELGCV